MKSTPAFSFPRTAWQALSRAWRAAARRGPARETTSELEGQAADRTASTPDPPTEPTGPNAQLEQEVAEHRRTEEALARRTAELEDARSFLDSVLENLPVMLFVKDAKDLKFVRWKRWASIAAQQSGEATTISFRRNKPAFS
jgi:PAS domain-containing protein